MKHGETTKSFIKPQIQDFLSLSAQKKHESRCFLGDKGDNLKQDAMAVNRESTRIQVYTHTAFCFFSFRSFLMFPPCCVGLARGRWLRMAKTAQILGCHSSCRIFKDELQDAASIVHRGRSVGSSRLPGSHGLYSKATKPFQRIGWTDIASGVLFLCCYFTPEIQPMFFQPNGPNVFQKTHIKTRASA